MGADAKAFADSVPAHRAPRIRRVFLQAERQCPAARRLLTHEYTPDIPAAVGSDFLFAFFIGRILRRWRMDKNLHGSRMEMHRR